VDIRGFFDSIDHGWLVKFLEHRIADQRVLRFIQKWLHAGVLEDGERSWVEAGTPQGGNASPLLANVYLHYVFDRWVRAGRKQQARGELMWCGSPMTWCWASSTSRRRSAAGRNWPNGFGSSAWSCIPTRPGGWNLPLRG